MYNIFKSVILMHRYELSEMLRKIDSFYVQGEITDSQRAELTKLAQENADESLSLNLVKKLEDLENRVKNIEDSNGGDVPVEEYHQFVQDKWYYQNDKITFENKKYKCIAPKDKICVWSPKDAPQYWEEII